MGKLFFEAIDQSQRAAIVFAAGPGHLRAGARAVSHQTVKPFAQILAVGRVLSTRLSAIRSGTAGRRPMHASVADGILAFGETNRARFCSSVDIEDEKDLEEPKRRGGS